MAEEERLRAEREVRVLFFSSGDNTSTSTSSVPFPFLCPPPPPPLPCPLARSSPAKNAALFFFTRRHNETPQQQVAAAAASNAHPLAEATLSKSRAAELDKLLNQTDLYTKFLSEQMDSIEQKTEAEAATEASAAAAAAGGGGKKGKKAGKGGAAGAASAAAAATATAADAAKKRKRSAEGLSPTQELLPLIKGELRDYQLRGKRGNSSTEEGARGRNRRFSARNCRKQLFFIVPGFSLAPPTTSLLHLLLGKCLEWFKID